MSKIYVKSGIHETIKLIDFQLVNKNIILININICTR